MKSQINDLNPILKDSIFSEAKWSPLLVGKEEREHEKSNRSGVTEKASLPLHTDRGGWLAEKSYAGDAAAVGITPTATLDAAALPPTAGEIKRVLCLLLLCLFTRSWSHFMTLLHTIQLPKIGSMFALFPLSLLQSISCTMKKKNQNNKYSIQLEKPTHRVLPLRKATIL